MMGALLEASIEVSLVLTGALAASALLRRRSASVRHWVLAVGIACAAVAPFLGFVAPSWRLTPETAIRRLLPEVATVAGSAMTSPSMSAADHVDRAAQPARQAPSRLPGPVRFVLPIWLAGIALSLLSIATGLARLRWLASRSGRADERWTTCADRLSRLHGLARRPIVLQSDHPTLVATWGFFRPRVLLPVSARDWSDERMRVVLGHELAHVRRGDWLSHLASQLVRSVYWFNPLAWIAHRNVRRESERASDDAVLSLGVNPSEYASHLLELARTLRDQGRVWTPGLGAIKRSMLERRISAMLNDRLNRRPVTPVVRATTAVVALLLTLAISGLVVFAQGRASLAGTVLDPTGRPAPNANVSVVNLETSATYAVPTAPAGEFRFADLLAGRYKLEVKTPGFKALTIELDLAAGAGVTRDVTLELGSVVETITVSGVTAVTSDAPDPGKAARLRQEIRDKFRGKSLQPPAKVKDERPQYPPHLWDANVEGAVVIEARIAADGTVQGANVVSAVHPELAAAALEAVNQWAFEPTRLWDQAVDTAMTIRVTFKRSQ